MKLSIVALDSGGVSSGLTSSFTVTNACHRLPFRLNITKLRV